DDPDREVKRLREEVAGADIVLISTPEYNGSMPGHLQGAVDWASRPFGPGSSLWGKPVAVIGASVTDYGAVWAQDHLRKSLGLAGARVVDVELPVARVAERLGPDGTVQDEETLESLAEIVGALAEHHRSLVAA